MEKPQRVLISGAAVSGCACALFLAREGIQVDLYDLRDETGTEGGGISLFPNGSRILQTLGLLDELARQGWTSQEVKHMTDNNQTLATTPGNIKGCATLRLRRHHLLTTLRKACSQHQGITAHWRKKVKSFTQTDDKVKLVFDDGSESPEADLLIAADGVHSRIRQQLYPKSAAEYMGRCLIGGYATKTGWRPWPDDALVYSQHGFLGGLGIDDETISWFADTVVAGDRGRGWNEFKESGGAAKVVKEGYKNWPEPVATIVRDLEASNTFLWPHYRVPAIDSWVNGRIVILGDAAHALAPPAAQGGSQALEDAQLLALCLSKGIDLNVWEKERRQRLATVTSVTDKAILLRRMSLFGGWAGFFLKTAIIKFIMNTSGVQSNLRLIYGYDVADLELPVASKL